MKRLLVLLMVFTTASLSQADGLRETIKVDVDQVPMTVRTAFEKDFGSVPEGGYWMARIERGDKTNSLAIPIWYSFNKGKKDDKIEVRYAPNGELISTHGINLKSTNEPTSFIPEKKIG